MTGKKSWVQPFSTTPYRLVVSARWFFFACVGTAE
jgi:hypothetical protein